MRRLCLLMVTAAPLACSAPPSSPPVAPAAQRSADRPIEARPLAQTAPVVAAPVWSVLSEGSCRNYAVFAVGAARVLAAGGAAYTLEEAGPKPLSPAGLANDMTGRGVDYVPPIVDVGGRDLDHVWIARMFESRTAPSIGAVVRVAGAWKTPEDPQDYGGFGGTLWAHPSGALWIGSNPMLAASRFEEFVDGELVKKAKMPGLDMTGTAYTFMPDGELLVVGPSEQAPETKAKLKRWSPHRPVNDVAIGPYDFKNPMSLHKQAGDLPNPRVIVGAGAPLGPHKKGTLLEWKDEKLTPVALDDRLTDSFTSALTPNGVLYALRGDGVLLREAAGAVSEIRVGEAGTVVAGATEAPWVVGVSGALYRVEADGAVHTVELGPGAWPLAERTKVAAQSVRVLGADEAYVVATRSERDPSWKKPRVTTVLYRFGAASAAAPRRCGAPLPTSYLARFAPALSASCNEPTLVPNKALDAAARKLLGVAPVRFGPGKKPSGEAYRATSVEQAREWIAALGKRGISAEGVCGTPDGAD